METIRTYYVSAGATGNDSNDGLSPSSPFKTIQKAADLTNPGDTVFIMNGVYKNTHAYGNVVSITRSGTSNALITYKAYPGDSPQLQSNGWNGISITNGASYIEINGLELIGNNSNITLDYALSQKDNPYNPQTNGNGIIIDGRNNNHPHHISIINNKIHDFGGGGIAAIQSDYLTIDRNEVYNNAWYSVYANSGISTWQNWQFDNSQGYKMIITNNKVYNNRQYIPWIATGTITDGNGIIIDDSRNTQNGSTLGAYSGRTLVENNITFQNGGSGIHSYSSDHVDIVNNTAYLNSQSPEINYGQIFANSSSDVNILNNILYAISGKQINDNYNNTNVTYNYNLYANSNIIPVKGANDIVADPQFVNASIGDFRLQSTSPAIDNGFLWTILTNDFAGNTRSSGAGYDIGAFEAGANTIMGGLDNNSYYVNNSEDIIIEATNEGTDTVFSTVSYTLGNNLENLTLQGTSAINGTGNAFENLITGNTADNILIGGAGADTIIGGSGNDSYYVDNIGDMITENPNEGIDKVFSTVSYTLGNNLENLTLQGTSAINGTGNALDNLIIGNNADNILTGGAGANTMIGGAGNDSYYVDATSDMITEDLNEGIDTVFSTVSYTLGNNLENLTLQGTSAINGTGNALDNLIISNNADNILMGGAGADTMIGGVGNDSYYVDNIGDSITENKYQGIDTVFSTVSYTLGNNLENLTLQGTSVINGTGNALNNIIIGNTADNILTGGAGADTMIGGAGNDSYYVDNTGDSITENKYQGIDKVFSTVSYTLGNNLENLTLQGTSAIDGTGNDLNNIITGNTADNIFTGGAGADTMIGGVGNDSYYVDNIGDSITENKYQGIDTVFSTVSYTLGNNLENLTLQGTSVINGTGNALNNIIIGNTADNILTGGAGADTMIGGAGNDSYYVDNTEDSITENLYEGIDKVFSTVSYTLGNNFENLTLQGTSAIDGTGNALNNIITGNTAANILTGGAGADTIIGGAGNDSYYVDNIGDSITENQYQGIDTVFSTVSYILANNLENLTLQGTSAINGTGNALNNIITGNTADNIITGGAGNDTLYLGLNDGAVDIVNYALNDGSDFVYQFVRGVGGDKIQFTGVANIDVVTSGANTILRIGDGTRNNTGFGTGQLLVTLSGITGFTATDINVNLFGTNFLFS